MLTTLQPSVYVTISSFLKRALSYIHVTPLNEQFALVDANPCFDDW
jgi:hypothetical protein